MSEAQLRDRIDYLEAEVDMLRKELGQSKSDQHLSAARRLFRIPPQQARLLLVVIDGRLRSYDALRAALWGNPDDSPETNALQVHVALLRKALRPHGIGLTTIWGFGLQMEAAECAKARAALGIEAKP